MRDETFASPAVRAAELFHNKSGAYDFREIFEPL
jgi:hypothetical protein